jgi:hypothetical protein
MAEVQTSEVDAKPAPDSLGLTWVKFGNHAIVVWQLKQYLCNRWSHSWTHCLITVTMVGGVIMETSVCSLQYLMHVIRYC